MQPTSTLCFIVYIYTYGNKNICERLIGTNKEKAMRSYTVMTLFITALTFTTTTLATIPFSAQLCDQSDFTCIRANYGDSWESLFPNPEQRDVVMRVNRMNTELYPGRLLAIPTNLSTVQINDLNPFIAQIAPTGNKEIIYDPKLNAWAAYDRDGQLVRWGPGASGADWCPDINAPCHTESGEFTIYAKGGFNCKSSIFPIPRGGAPMPFCMYFHGGFALHGSYEVPGFNASHGCVRMFVQDAQWLNQRFIDVGSTKVIILPYD